MPNDNTLGAPTEGLGQRVTFAFDPGNRVPQLQLDRGGVGRSGVVGGGSGAITQAGQVHTQPNPTMELLGKVADGIIRPKLEQAKQDAYFSGMQRAMAGEAVADIAKNQPWYSTLFGESDVAEGARAYTSQAVAQTTVASMEDNMHELRKLPPSEAQAYFNKTINDAKTGDRATDAATLTAMTRALPSLMRRQSKEYYGYQQEVATTAEAGAFKAGASRLQSAAKGLTTGVTTQEEFDAITKGFVQSVIPVAGRDLKNYKESMKDNLAGWAQAGNFHALNALRDKGFFEVLDADQATTVEKATEAGESKLRTKYSMDWNDELAMIEAQAGKPLVGQTTSDIAHTVDGINSRYMQETGSKTGLIPPNVRAAMLSGSAIKIAQEKDRLADKAASAAEKLNTAGDKAAAQAAKQAIIAERAGDGSLGTLSRNKAYGKEDIDEVVNPMYQALSPAGQVKFLVNNSRENYVIDSIKDTRVGQIKAALNAQIYTPQVQEAFDKYAKLYEANPETAKDYYGEFAVPLEGFYRDLKNGAAPEGAFRDRFVGPGRKVKLDKQELKDTLDVINRDYNSYLPEWMGGQKLKPGTARRVANEIADATEKWAGATGNTKEAASRALKTAKSNGLEIVGGYAWQNSKGQSNLTDWLTKHIPSTDARVGTDKINDLVEGAVEELLYGSKDGAGILPEKASDTYIGRLDDRAGVPMFHVQSVVDGTVYDGTLAATDVYTLAAKRRKAKETSTLGIPNEKLRFGGPITSTTVPEDQPSIYDSPEAWAKYRQRQKAKTK